MPSGGAADGEAADAAQPGAGLGQKGARGGGISAVLAAGGGAAGAALGRAGTGAEAAMQAAAAVAHGRLAAAAAGAGMRAAARGGQEVAGRGAVPEPAAAVRRQRGTVRRGGGWNGGMEPMPSGGDTSETSSHRSSPKT
jgi:hypothetical protein